MRFLLVIFTLLLSQPAFAARKRTHAQVLAMREAEARKQEQQRDAMTSALAVAEENAAGAPKATDRVELEVATDHDHLHPASVVEEKAEKAIANVSATA